MDWHISDPVSAEELDRNNNGFNHQNNRNPFIDNPTYALAIWDENFSNEEFQSVEVQIYPNPVKGQYLNIKTKGLSHYGIEIFNIFGNKFTV